MIGEFMLDCFIIGDSIAKGISDVRPECAHVVKSGINSRDWINKNHDLYIEAKNVIISLGTNDLKNINTYEELKSLRQMVWGTRVFWILPAIDKPSVKDSVFRVSQEFGDVLLPIPEVSPDKVHPTYKGYKKLAEETKTSSGKNN